MHRTASRSTHSYDDFGAPGMLPKVIGPLDVDGSQRDENAVRWTCVHPVASRSWRTLWAAYPSAGQDFDASVGAYHQIPQAIASHRLPFSFGRW